MQNNQECVTLNSIGQRVRELRHKKGLSQTQLAHLIGCAPNTITEWEKRKGRAPGKKLLPKVAEVLEVSVDHLLGKEKRAIFEIFCYGEVASNEFTWPDSEAYYIEVPASEYSSSRFSFRILDNLLEPIVSKGDFAIFERLAPEDGDIVAVRLPEEGEKGMIKRWRQGGNVVMLSEINLHQLQAAYFFEVVPVKDNGVSYKIKKSHGCMVVEGKLVTVKRAIKSVTYFPKINYIFF